MGNSKSKVAKAELNEKLDLAEKNHASAVKTIVVREEELERCKREAATATSESEGLRKKAEDLESKYASLQQQRAAEVEGLKKELAKELEGQVRIHESLTQERNRERRRVEQLENKIKEAENTHADQLKAASSAQDDKIKSLGQDAATARAQADAEIKRLQEASAADRQNIATAEGRTAELENRVRALKTEATAAAERAAATELQKSTADKANNDLTQRLTTMQSQLAASEAARTDLGEKHSALTNQISVLNSSQDSKLATLSTNLTTSQQKQQELTKQLTTLQKQLDLSETRRSDMEKKYNEGVSKKSALHEAFEATKLELKDSYERYAELHQEVTKLKAQLQGQQAEHPAVKSGVDGATTAARAAMKELNVKVEEVKAAA